MASPGSVVIQFLVDAKKAATDAADLAKNFGKVDKEADNLDATLDQLESELDSIARATADIAGDMSKAEIGFDSLGDEAEQTADRVRRAAQDMARGVHDGRTGIDTETAGIRQNMADTGKEAGAEFVENIAEGIGSGQASLKDVVSGSLGGIVNLATTLTNPVAIGVAGAVAGIGLMYQAIQGQNEKAQAAVTELRDALKEVGNVSSEAARDIIFQMWVTEAEKVPGKIAAIDSAIQTAKVSADDFQRALAGDQAARDRVIKALTDQYAKILANKRETGNITEEQKKYLATTDIILQDLGKQKGKVAAVKEEQEALNSLTGTTAEKVKKWKGNLDDTATVMELIRRQAETIEGSHPVNFIVTTKDKNGRPVKLGPASLMVAPPATAGVSTFAAPTQTVAPQTMNISVEVDQWGSARVTKRALEANDRRQGRTPGKRLSVAW